MGTRGAWGFRVDGQDKLTYNHFDSYPDGLGRSLLEQLGKRREARSSDWIENLKTQVRKLRIVHETDDEPSDADRDNLQEFCDPRVGSGGSGWYSLLRHTQGDMELTLRSGVMIDHNNFMLDSLFCEYAYVINLDESTIEMYKGFQTKPHTDGRYASNTPHEDRKSAEYYPVKLMATFPLTDIPHDWMDKVDPPEDDES